MSNLKKLIRERMAKHGESYQAAHRVVTRANSADGPPTADMSFLFSQSPQSSHAIRPRRRIYDSGAEVLPPLVGEGPKTEASRTGATLPEHFEKLGEPRHDGDMVEQQVLVGPWRIAYSLTHDRDDSDQISVTIGGAGDAPLPDWVIPTAYRYRDTHKRQLLEMLHAARHGDFRADHHGVSATLQAENVEFGAWYTSWDDDRPMIQWVRGGHIDYDVAQGIALAKFREVPAEMRKRLFQVARPWESDDV